MKKRTGDTTVRALALGAERVSAMLADAQEHPDKRLTDAAFKKAFAYLAEDMWRIEAEADATEHARWPDGLGDTEVHQRIETIQRARLAVFVAVVLLAAEMARAGGYDIKAPHALCRALGSALTGTGVEHKHLRPPKIHTAALKPHELDLRARLVALAELVEGDPEKLSRLYDAAERAGLDRERARRIVANERAGRLNDPTFQQLYLYWTMKLAPLVAAGRDIGELLDL